MSGSSSIVAMKKVVQQLRLEAGINRVKVHSCRRSSCSNRACCFALIVCICWVTLPLQTRLLISKVYIFFYFISICRLYALWLHQMCNRCPRPRRTCRSSACNTPSRTRCSPACRPATTRSDRRKSAPSYSTDTSSWVHQGLPQSALSCIDASWGSKMAQYLH